MRSAVSRILREAERKMINPGDLAEFSMDRPGEVTELQYVCS